MRTNRLSTAQRVRVENEEVTVIDNIMLVAGMRRLCRMGLAAVLVTALCVLTLVDLPPQLPETPPDPPPTPGGEPPATKSIVAYSWARRLALDYRPSKDCDVNRTALRTTGDRQDLSGVNWVETIPGYLFLYSAHLDKRIPGYPSIRVIGVKRGPLLASTLFCTIWYEKGQNILSLSMEALISTIWLDEWGDSDEGYTAVLINCPLPVLEDARPKTVFVGHSSCYQNTSHSIVINSANAEPSEKWQFTLCIKGLDFDEDISQQLIAFVEFNRILGARFFHFYVFNVHENVLNVLRMYERSNVVRWSNFTLPGDLPKDKHLRRKIFAKDLWIKRRMELIPYNHCFYESLYKSEYVIPIDIDETIVPVKRKHWSKLMLDEKKRMGRSFKDYAAYAVRNAYFFPELQNKTRTNWTASDNNTIDDLTYLSTTRAAVISPKGDSIKSFISTKRALTVHNHFPLTPLNPTTKMTHHMEPTDVLKHHHRICDWRHLDCDLLMEEVSEDNSALKYADQLKARIKTSVENLNNFVEHVL